MLAEGLGLYYEYDLSMWAHMVCKINMLGAWQLRVYSYIIDYWSLLAPYDILNIHAWIMVAEDVVLYCIHNWSMLVHTIYKNICANNMSAEGLGLYYGHDWSVLALKGYNMYVHA